MTKSETAKLLFVVKANYSRFYNNISQREFEEMVYAWHICICDYDFLLAQAGLKVFLSSETKGFPPTVGQIISCIHKTQNDADDTLTEMDAWGIVYKAICNSNYCSAQEFVKLPAIVQRTVGDPARLREWALLENKDVQTVIQSNFMRSFKAIQNQKKEYQKMPDDIKQKLPNTKWSAKLIVDTQEEMEPLNIICSNPDFIGAQMEQFYENIGYKRG